MKISDTFRSYEWLLEWLEDEAYRCYKLCGCARCTLEALDEFAFSDDGVYWLR